MGLCWNRGELADADKKGAGLAELVKEGLPPPNNSG